MAFKTILILILLISLSFAAIDNCQTLGTNASNEEICSQCNDTYHQSIDQKSCIQNIDNCTTYNSTNETECQTCDNNFIISSDNMTCYAKIINCTDGQQINNICNQCSNNYHGNPLNDSTSCVQDIDNCITYQTSDTSLCEDCGVNYISSDQLTCHLPIQNCQTQVSNECNQCNNNFHAKADNTQCYADIDNCNSYDTTDPSLCDQCTDEGVTFNLSQDKLICYNFIQNCATGQQVDNLCNQCATNFHVKADNSQCFADIPNCQQYNINDPSLCEQCNEQGVTYHLSQDKLTCHDKIEGCSIQVDNNCNQCITGYHLDTNDTTVCLINIQNCVTYQANNMELCETCVTGKTLSNNNLYCYGDISNCQTQIEYICDTCNENFHKSTNNQLCHADIQNCTTYDDNSDRINCQACEVGYHTANLINNSNKNNCFPDIIECQSYSTLNNYHCNVCNDTFILTIDKQKCVLKVDNCQYYNEERVCQQCNSGYHLDDTGLTSCIQDVKNCESYSQDSLETCIQCKSGYKLNQNKCQLNCLIEGCLTCQNLFTCEVCNTGLSRSESQLACRKSCEGGAGQSFLNCNDCTSTYCLTCVEKFYLASLTDKLCYPCSIYGSKCTSCTQAKCEICDNNNQTKYHIYVPNGHCLSCEQIASRFQQTTQVGCIECQVADSQVSCTKCDVPFYYLVDTLCVKCSEILNCVQCINSKQCLVCKSTFYPTRNNSSNKNQCSACSNIHQNYKECKLSDTGDLVIPVQCVDGYFVDLNQDNEKCQECIQNCLLCENNSQCLKCKQGFYRNEDTKICFQQNPSSPIALSTITSIDQVFTYTQILVNTQNINENSQQTNYYNFDINNTINSFFCTKTTQVTQETNTEGICINGGECKSNYCECQGTYFGNICQFDTTKQNNLQVEFDKLRIKLKELIVDESNNFINLENENLVYILKMIQILSDLLRITTKEQYQELNSLITQIIDNYGTSFENTNDLKYLLQIGLNFVDGLKKNTTISDSNKLTLERSQYGQQIITKTKQLILNLIKRQEIKTVELSHEKSKLQIYYDDITDSNAFSQIRGDATSENRRLLNEATDYSDTQSFITCTDEKLYKGEAFVTSSDMNLLKERVLSLREGTNNSVTITTANYNQDKYIAFEDIDTSIYEVLLNDYNDQTITMSSIEFELYVKIPKKSLLDTENISKFNCKQWDSSSQSWKNLYINSSNTINCKNYVICQSTQFGAFAAIQDQYSLPSNTTEDGEGDKIITAEGLFNQPGFIINIILLIFFFLFTGVFCFTSESSPQKTKQKQIHMPELEQAYQKQLAHDHQKYLEEEENRKNGISNIQAGQTVQHLDHNQINLQLSFNQQMQQPNQYQQRNQPTITMQPRNLAQQSYYNQQQQIGNSQIGQNSQNPVYLNRSQNQTQQYMSQSPYTQKNQYNQQQSNINPHQSYNPQQSIYSNNLQQQQQMNMSNNLQNQQMNMSNNMQANQYQQQSIINDQQQQQIYDAQQTEGNMHTQDNLQTMDQIKVYEETTINPWMLHPIYSIHHTREINMRIMKLSLVIATLQFYVLMLSVMFGYREVDHGVAVLFFLLSMLFTWIFNYIWGFVACLFRNEEGGKNSIYSLYWLLFAVLYIGLSIGSMIACYNEQTVQFNMIIIGFFVCLILDFIFLDLFIVFTLSQIHEESNDGFVKMTKILKYKGYYEEE